MAGILLHCGHVRSASHPACRAACTSPQEFDTQSHVQTACVLQGGWNPAALWACAVGIAPSLPGFLHEVGLVSSVASIWRSLYGLSWFVGTALAMLVYCWLMKGTGQASQAA